MCLCRLDRALKLLRLTIMADSWEHRIERVLKTSLEVQQESLAVHKTQLEWFRSQAGSVTTSDLDRLENKIMSAISDFAAKQKAFNERQGAAIDSAVASVNGLTADVKALNDKITELQNSSGGVTPEDQALINELETQGEAVAAKAEAAAAALKALDEQTPPVVPPNP